MGPALIEPDHLVVPPAHAQLGLGAAMGPALIEPDHVSAGPPPRSGVPPQWGRLSSSRITRPSSRPFTRSRVPQWGRLSSSRITHRLPHRQRRLPRRNGAGSHRAGSNVGITNDLAVRTEAAMGPALIEPDHRHEVHPRRRGQAAAMGPALIEPDHAPPPAPATAAPAPQWGRLSSSRITSRSSLPETWAMRPQWGRLSSSRITSRQATFQEAWAKTPQWGRLSSSRITALTRRMGGVKASRNGAGSHRAGSRCCPFTTPHVHRIAAMGPALIEPDHLPAPADHVDPADAAMGPALIEPDHVR